MGDRTKVLYIAGMGRNGGTLLDRILGQMPDVFSLGELRFVWKKGVLNNELCNCGVPFKECDFWGRVFHTAFGGFDENLAASMISLYRRTDRTRHLPLLISPWKPKQVSNRWQEYISILQRQFSAIREESGCDVLVDSSKTAGYGLTLSKVPGVSLYVVHLVRDSRATAFSWSKKKLKPEVWDQQQQMRRYPIWYSVLKWSYVNAAAQLLRSHSDGYLLVRYEDLVHAPREVLCEILRLVGKPCENLPFTEERTVLLGQTHTQSGNPSRFREGEVQIYYDDEWRRKMSLWQQLLATALSWPLLLRYRYPIRGFRAGG